MADFQFWPLHRGCPKCGKRGIAAWKILSETLVCQNCQSRFKKVWFFDFVWMLALQCLFLILVPATVLAIFWPLSWYFAACVAAWIFVFVLDAMVPLREVHLPKPSDGEIENAKRHPNGWVYRIAGPFGPHDEVPPEAIVGAWRINARGEIVGEFERNRRYDPALWSSGHIYSRPGPRTAECRASNLE